MNDVLVDTNVLIYAKDKSSVFHQWSIDVLQKNSCFTTSKNLSEYYAVVTRGDKPALTPKEALRDIIEFQSYFSIIFSTPNSYKKLIQLTRNHHPKGLKFHDFEIAAIAISNGIKRIATLNIGDFDQIEGIELVIPSKNLTRK